jgi:hypothetical protein
MAAARLAEAHLRAHTEAVVEAMGHITEVAVELEEEHMFEAQVRADWLQRAARTTPTPTPFV